MATRADRYALAKRLARAAATAAPPAAAVLADLAGSARDGAGPLTAEVDGLGGAGRKAVADALAGLLTEARVTGDTASGVLVFAVAGWHEWMRHAG
jgi:hypothetical protein